MTICPQIFELPTNTNSKYAAPFSLWLCKFIYQSIILLPFFSYCTHDTLPVRLLLSRKKRQPMASKPEDHVASSTMQQVVHSSPATESSSTPEPDKFQQGRIARSRILKFVSL